MALFTVWLPNNSNISRSKDKQTMRFGQSIEYSKKKVFFIKSHAEIEAGRIVASPFF